MRSFLSEHMEALASLGDLIHRKRSPFPLREEGEAALGDLISQLR